MNDLPLVFDFDGTLVDSSIDIARAVNRMRGDRDLEELPRDTIRGHIGHGALSLFKQTLPDAETMEDHRLVEEFRDHYHPICTDNIRPFPGIDRLCREVGDNRAAIVTNKPEPLTRRILRELEWEDSFYPILGRDTLEEHKPDPLPLRYVARKWELDPNDLIMVGDSWSDVEAGRRAGAITVGCQFGMGPESSPAEADPDHLVEDAQQLRDLLTSISNDSK